ncbi:MAG: hypothetical protein QXU98_04495 [Candidatus Parvarchaeota archaeon]
MLKSTLDKIEKYLEELTVTTITLNKIRLLFEYLDRQLSERTDITDGEERIVKSLIQVGKYGADAIANYVKYANEFFDEIKDGDLDIPHIKLKLEAIYIQMWGITEQITALGIIYNTLCVEERLCDEIKNEQMWEIYRQAEYVMYTIFDYMTNF